MEHITSAKCRDEVLKQITEDVLDDCDAATDLRDRLQWALDAACTGGWLVHQPIKIVLPDLVPTAIAPAFLRLGWFYERRRWRIQIRQYRYCLRPFLIRNHLQANGFCSLRWECCHHQQRQQCPSHAPPERWPTFSTTSVRTDLLDGFFSREKYGRSQ